MELMPNFQLHRPSTLSEAIKLKHGDSRSNFVAGGTDMIVNVRRGIEQPNSLIDLSNIEDIKTIKKSKNYIEIGAGVSLKTLQNDMLLQQHYPAIIDSAKAVAGPTHQQYGTVGGNLCLDTRCLFYNQSEWWRESNDYCLKERGEICHVAPGGKRCFAAYSGDLAPSLLVYEAKIDVLGPDGFRSILLQDLYNNDGMKHLTLDPLELVAKVRLPFSLAGHQSRYEKARIRGSIDFPLAGAAVRLQLEKQKKVGSLSVALTGVNPNPQLISNLDYFVGKKLGVSELDKLRDIVRKQAKPMRTTTVAPWYRRRVVGAIARRLVKELVE